jgi:hypothetical protein
MDGESELMSWIWRWSKGFLCNCTFRFTNSPRNANDQFLVAVWDSLFLQVTTPKGGAKSAFYSVNNMKVDQGIHSFIA